MADTDLEILRKLHEIFTLRSLRLAVAESCTAGMISHMLASRAGAKAFFDASVVCISPECMRRVLGIDPSFRGRRGLASAELAEEMARRVEDMSSADVGMAVSCDLKREACGEGDRCFVYIGVSSGKEATSRGFLFDGPPEEVRQSASNLALRFLYKVISAWT